MIMLQNLFRNRLHEHPCQRLYEAAVRQAYRDFGGRRFILAGTCAVLTGTPRENLVAAAETAQGFE